MHRITPTSVFAYIRARRGFDIEYERVKFAEKEEKNRRKRHKTIIKDARKGRRLARKERKYLLDAILLGLSNKDKTAAYVLKYTGSYCNLVRWHLGVWAQRNIPEVVGFLGEYSNTKIVIHLDQYQFDREIDIQDRVLGMTSTTDAITKKIVQRNIDRVTKEKAAAAGRHYTKRGY